MRNKSEKEIEALAKVEPAPECTAMVRAETKLSRLKRKRRRRGGRSSLDMVAMAALAFYAYTVGERYGKEKAER